MDPLTHNSTSFWMKLDHCIQTQGRKRADVLYSLDWLLEVRIILISEFQKFYEGNLRWVHLQSEVQRTAKSDNKGQLWGEKSDDLLNWEAHIWIIPRGTKNLIPFEVQFKHWQAGQLWTHNAKDFGFHWSNNSQAILGIKLSCSSWSLHFPKSM